MSNNNNMKKTNLSTAENRLLDPLKLDKVLVSLMTFAEEGPLTMSFYPIYTNILEDDQYNNEDENYKMEKLSPKNCER